MTKEAAVKLAQSGFWKEMSQREIAMFQMFEPRLCMPFNVFHKAVEETLGRPVFTHEFGLNHKGIQRELLGEKAAPTFQEILEMIPAEKRILIVS